MLLNGSGQPRAGWQAMAEQKLAEIDAQVQRLETMRAHLTAALSCGWPDVATCDLVSAAAQRRAPHHAGSAAGGR